MPTMFPPRDPQSITYFKMYSTFRNDTTEDCFAFILMPNSRERRFVSLQCIQFDFNVYGEVRALRCSYSGLDENILKKVRETQSGIAALKPHYGRGEELSVFNKKNNTLNMGFITCNDSSAYLSDVLNVIQEVYGIKIDFFKEIKLQLLSQEYLAKEFVRLGGKVVPAPDKHDCTIM